MEIVYQRHGETVAVCVDCHTGLSRIGSVDVDGDGCES